MNPKTLVEGLKMNYHESLHPSSTAEKDMIRTLRNLDFEHEQNTKIYEWLLANCQFFPKVYDIHEAVRTLKIHKQGTAISQTELTRREIERRKEYEKDAISLDEWLRTGGYEFVCEQFHGDPVKIRQHLARMGKSQYFRSTPDGDLRKKDHVAKPVLLDEALPWENKHDFSKDFMVEPDPLLDEL